jgi:hypothetical protein
MDFSVETATGKRTISIVLPDRPYGVLVSGGLDSSVLLSLILMTRAKENSTVPFTAFNIKRGVGTELFSEKMMWWTSVYFKQEFPFQHLELPPDTPHYDCLRIPGVSLLNGGKVACLFSADTSNPPGFVHHQAPERTPVEKQFSFPRWRLPFLHCDKSHIVQLMYDLRLTFIEHLSHTCFAQNIYRCGKCFQCMERAWAYSTTGNLDSGIH